MRDNRRFKDVIHTIKGAEKGKDKFLKASRLDRHERKPRFSFDSDDLIALMAFATIWLMMILFFIGTR